MLTRRRIPFTVGALVVAVTSVPVLATPAMFAGATATPPLPVTCQAGADVTFSPPITRTGTHTTNRATVTTMTVSDGKLNRYLSAAADGTPTRGTFAVTVLLPATRPREDRRGDDLRHRRLPRRHPDLDAQGLTQVAVGGDVDHGGGGHDRLRRQADTSRSRP